MHPTQDARVILRHCDDYDPVRIQEIVGDALDELGLVPHGRVLVKPNIVMAGELFRHAYTRPEVTQGIVKALQARAQGVTELGIGERCGITVPSRYAFREAGYDRVFRRTGAVRHLFDEVSQVEIPLRHPGRLRDSIYVPEPVARADFFVNVPKFKAHPWTTVTFSLKNYIGIQDDRHRLIDHDWALNRKIADLQHVLQPQLVVVDAITAGQGRMLTPIPFPLHLLVLGNNQVAVDAVCCRILGLDPREVEHIRLAHEDGFGPLTPTHVGGDVSLEEARERAQGFRLGLVRVEKYFEGTRISAYAGPPPGGTDGYCWGGCPGALEEAIEVLRVYDAECDEKMRRMHVVFGAYDGPLDLSYGDKVLFVGDCVEFRGQLGSELVSIESLYRDRSALDPTEAPGVDIYAKMLQVMAQVQAAEHKPYLRLAGCPVSVSELILALSLLGGVNNPYLSPQEAVRFTSHYLRRAASLLGKRLGGQAGLVQAFGERGAARPSVSLEERESTEPT